jgi:N-hydroxyarylamine O-acetyltransferase
MGDPGTAMPMDLMTRYLARLGLTEHPAPSRYVLGDLVARHQQAIPFENLDVIDGRRADLTTAGVLHKVAIRQRGGFCYELNEAFAALLTHLGFTVRRIEARVWAPPRQAFGAPFDHLALVVTLPEGEFLTDVGFGDNNRTPLRLPADALTDISGQYTLGPADPGRSDRGLWRLSRPDRILYDMTLEAQPLSAFEPMYRFHRSSPDSIFTKGLICTRTTPTGRVSVTADRLIVLHDGVRTEAVVSNRDEALQCHFGIVKEVPAC